MGAPIADCCRGIVRLCAADHVPVRRVVGGFGGLLGMECDEATKGMAVRSPSLQHAPVFALSEAVQENRSSSLAHLALWPVTLF